MKQVSFEFSVGAGHPSLAGHFPGRPIVPGVLLLDHVMEGLAASCGREVARVVRVKFKSALLPAEVASAECDVDGDRVSFHVITQREGSPVPIAEGLVEFEKDAR